MSNGILFKVDVSTYDILVERINVINGDLLQPKKFSSKVFDLKIKYLIKLIATERPDKIVFDKVGMGLGFYELFVKRASDKTDECNFAVDAFGLITYDELEGEEVVKKGLTEIYFILDKSGSMNSIKDDAIGGFNNFVEEQLKNEGETNVNLVLFDTNVTLHNDITKIDEKIYQPSGMTALLDAIGIGIENMNKKLYNTPESERPENIIFTIMTDGMENASKEYNKSAIEQMIKEKTALDWQFIFMGANIDAVSTAKGLGINGAFAGEFVALDGMANKAMLNASEMITTYRATGDMRAYNVDVKINVENDAKKTASEIAKEIVKTIDKQKGLR